MSDEEFTVSRVNDPELYREFYGDDPDPRYLNIDVQDFGLVLMVRKDGTIALHGPGLDAETIRYILRTVADTMPDEVFRR